MIKNQNIICISSIDWDFVWQGHQEIMSTFAKNGNKVLYIENTGVRPPNFKDIPRLRKRIANWFKSAMGFRKEMDNLYIYSPVILPFPYSRIACWINRRILLRPIKNWTRVMKFHDPIIWTFLPTGTAMDVINNLERKLLIYYCIADFYELVGDYKKVRKVEDELIRKSDLIFAQGKVLYDKCEKLNDNVHIFPFGVNVEVFEDFKHNPHKIPEDIRGIKKPIIGYVGGVHKHIDFKLIRHIAQIHPEWSIVLVGPLQTGVEEIGGLGNVYLLGKKEFSELPGYINEFDVCIVPYLRSEYTDTVYPTKMNEYHALGKPVVSTELPEVVNFNKENNNLIFIGKTYEEFGDRILQALNKGQAADYRAERITSARKNSWFTRIEEMSRFMEAAINRKSGLSFDWKNKFLQLYTNARKKILKIALVSLIIYLAVFYTPLLWFLASPLKISQAPGKADCIVVFAGGVGESGKIGQGYEERVEYAAELYKKGYANKIIFSSGYMYIFKEPLVMKALAISSGVPESAIILEDKAGSTYENVKFSSEILTKNNWNSILLVSSPYHMRRASSVFNKIARDIKVFCTPTPRSLFYLHGGRDIYGRKIWKQVNIHQIDGILHEYLGIIYYWYKGYI